jgi:hypothetical protein
MARLHRPVAIVGRIVEVNPSKAGRHVYIEFSASGQPPFLARAILKVEDGGQSDACKLLSQWVGKSVRVSGKVDIERFKHDGQSIARPKILPVNLDDIIPLE